MWPLSLKERLDQAPHRHVVHKGLENFSDWFRSRRPPFFPDYTNPGIQYIEQVPDEAWVLRGGKPAATQGTS
ncbi:MAG: hypothetical protein ACRYFZ_20755 [Janthinobacterium lividum]